MTSVSKISDVDPSYRCGADANADGVLPIEPTETYAEAFSGIDKE